MMAPSGGKGNGQVSQSNAFQTYQDFSALEDDAQALPANFSTGSGFGGK